jgi:hypothetical protein
VVQATSSTSGGGTSDRTSTEDFEPATNPNGPPLRFANPAVPASTSSPTPLNIADDEDTEDSLQHAADAVPGPAYLGKFRVQCQMLPMMKEVQL